MKLRQILQIIIYLFIGIIYWIIFLQVILFFILLCYHLVTVPLFHIFWCHCPCTSGSFQIYMFKHNFQKLHHHHLVHLLMYFHRRLYLFGFICRGYPFLSIAITFCCHIHTYRNILHVSYYLWYPQQTHTSHQIHKNNSYFVGIISPCKKEILQVYSR